MVGTVLVAGDSERPGPVVPCVKTAALLAIGRHGGLRCKAGQVDGLDGMKRESGFGMTLTQDDLTLLLIAQNARFRVASRLTTKNQTGYQIRPECDLFGRKPLPVHVQEFLVNNGLPAQRRYTRDEHLNRLLRLIKPFVHFTKEPKGFIAVSRHLGCLPSLRKHDDVLQTLEVLDNESI